MSNVEIEKRLSAIEQEIADLKDRRQSNGKRSPIESLEAIHGSLQDDEALREASRLGRKWRRSQGAGTRKSKVRGK
jgi:hypothetical protein